MASRVVLFTEGLLCKKRLVMCLSQRLPGPRGPSGLRLGPEGPWGLRLGPEGPWGLRLGPEGPWGLRLGPEGPVGPPLGPSGPSICRSRRPPVPLFLRAGPSGSSTSGSPILIARMDLQG